jgi:hypothetical protein
MLKACGAFEYHVEGLWEAAEPVSGLESVYVAV